MEDQIRDCRDELRQTKIELALMNDNVIKLNELLKKNPDTGLYNKHILLQKISKRIRESRHKPFAYGIIRMDHHYQKIRHYRDRQKILIYITAQRIKEVIPEDNLFQSDRADEFLFIIPNAKTENDILPYHQKLIDAISEPHNLPAADLSFGCYMGITLYPAHGKTVEELMDNAEIALGVYEQRHDQSFLYSPEQGERLNRKRTAEEIMSRAVGNQLQGFHVAYQPIVDQEKKVISCEALMRWEAPGLGSITPGEFIPIAEETGLINTLGHWILYTSLLQVKKWRKATGSDITVSVNVSSVQLDYPHYIENVRNVLESLEMDGAALHLEVTESTLMDEPQKVIEKLQLLRDMGIKIMLDDFGTGFSSLSYLHQLPIDILKVAREFVIDITTNQKNLDVVRAIQSISDSFDLTTLAEGVETQEQFDILINEGCSLIQGYITSPPVDAVEFQEHFLVNKS